MQGLCRAGTPAPQGRADGSPDRAGETSRSLLTQLLGVAGPSYGQGAVGRQRPLMRKTLPETPGPTWTCGCGRVTHGPFQGVLMTWLSLQSQDACPAARPLASGLREPDPLGRQSPSMGHDHPICSSCPSVSGPEPQSPAGPSWRRACFQPSAAFMPCPASHPNLNSLLLFSSCHLSSFLLFSFHTWALLC